MYSFIHFKFFSHYLAVAGIPFDATKYWHIFDNKRQGFNPNNYRLNPNANEVETTTTGVIDFLSNGFKIRTNQQQFGTSGATYIYMAFAEHPFVASNGDPATAR